MKKQTILHYIFKIIIALVVSHYSIPSLAATDSTHHMLSKSKPAAKSLKYKSYVDTEDCVTTDKKIYAFVFGTGGGNLNQECPSSYPVLYKINQIVVYTTAIPYFGATVAGGGHNQLVCCAMKHKWD